MQLSLSNRILRCTSKTKVIAIVILAALTFTFMHSEFGIFDFDGNDHSSHDYCTLVKYTSDHTIKTSRDTVLKFKFEKAAPIIFHENFSSHYFSTNQFDFDNFNSLNNTDRVYLLNCTFLI